jgi:membrane protease YdiL (CAAX protease family)
VLFIIGNVCLSLIIGICYAHSQNLLVPIWIHFLSNAMAVPYGGPDMRGRLWLAVFYVFATSGFVVWHIRKTTLARKAATGTIGAAQL